MHAKKIIGTFAVLGAAASVLCARPAHGEPPPGGQDDLAQQIFDTMIQVHGTSRWVFGRCMPRGSFVTGFSLLRRTLRRFPKPLISTAHPCRSPCAFPMAHPTRSFLTIPPTPARAGWRSASTLPGGARTDIIAMSHNGFIVANGEEFLALQKSIVATDPSKPHPWPVEAFLGAHPLALKFVQESAVVPASFANVSFFANDAFIFVNKAGVKQGGRYKIIPIDGPHDLTEAEAKAKSPNFLIDDLKARLATTPIKFHLLIQLANADDQTKDPSLVWPDDRKTIDAGTISITAVDLDKGARQ